MKRSNRFIWLAGVVIVVLISISFFAAPSSKINSGSTYNHQPDGYSAWYNFMQKRYAIQHWQRPFTDILHEKGMATMIQINSSLVELTNVSEEQEHWLEKGNTLIILGVRQPVTAAKFNTQQNSDFGNIIINTSRRYTKSQPGEIVLGDHSGAIVWKKTYGKGQAIFATTAYLAANAYSGYNNFTYLAQLVGKTSQQVFVDEYIHGYEDRDIRNQEKKASIVTYLMNTPLFLVVVQVSVFLLIFIRAENMRFGKPIALDTTAIDNSQVYINALATVLQKAESRNFVLEMVGKEEQIQLQKALGLNQTVLLQQPLLQAWSDKTCTSTVGLDRVLKLQQRKNRISEQELISWLEEWQRLREITRKSGATRCSARGQESASQESE